MDKDEQSFYQMTNLELKPLSYMALAYLRARGSDPLSSFGDWIALSDKCDIHTAELISKEVDINLIIIIIYHFFTPIQIFFLCQ